MHPKHTVRIIFHIVRIVADAMGYRHMSSQAPFVCCRIGGICHHTGQRVYSAATLNESLLRLMPSKSHSVKK